MDRDTYVATFAEDSAPGWQAIDAALGRIYGDREPVAHLAPVPHFAVGGTEPLDGVSAYVCRDPAHLHFVGYGLSQLYHDPDAAGGDVSGWGFEFTFRLAHPPVATSADVPRWPIGLMQNLAKYVLRTGNGFAPEHFMRLDGPLEHGSDSALVGFVVVLDPELGVVDTPHGAVEMLQLVGVTRAEVDALYAEPRRISELVERLAAAAPGPLVTDMARRGDLIG